MKKLWIAFALMACLSFAACGESSDGGGDSAEEAVSPMVGTWVFDTDTAVAAIEKKLAEDPVPMGGMMLDIVKSMKAEMVISEDGTFTADMKMPDPMTGESKSETARGTWKLDGDQITITTTEKNGKVDENPDTQSATVKDGVITVPAQGGSPFEMVFRKK